MAEQLTDTERAVLAQEIAADKAGYYSNWQRAAFIKGWDAAVEWMTTNVQTKKQHTADTK